MSKKLFVTSLSVLVMSSVALAEPSHTSSTFPLDGKMLADYLYQNQANQTNLKVSSGNASTTAIYLDCPGDYSISDAGATSTDECYKNCTVADLNDAHAATASGKNYYGANLTDTCAIATCNTGYTLNPGLNLATVIGATEAGTAFGYIDHSGTYTNGTGDTTQQTYGITAPDTFGVDYGSGKGRITGKSVCSTASGTNNWDGNATTSDNVTADFTNGANCWCQIDSYTSPSGVSQSLSAPWVFDGNLVYASDCASLCTNFCASSLQDGYENLLAYRSGVFNATTPVEASCNANEYTVTLNKNGNDAVAGTASVTATYDVAMPTPITAPTQAGNVFAGYYDTSETTGGTEYYTAAGASGHIWDKTDANPTLYARWTQCAAGSYCPGDNTTQSCPNDYASSAAGSNKQTDCYKACSTSQFAHSASVSGNYYYGFNGTTCTISCEDGYTLNPGNPDLTTLIGVTEAATASAYIRNDGYTYGTPSDFGISANNTFGVDYGTGKGKITGKALCSTQPGSTSPRTTNTTMTPEFGVQGAQYCYCQLDSYTSPSGTTQSLSASWVFHNNYGSVSDCTSVCTNGCANNLMVHYSDALAFRAAMFNAAAPSAPSCVANTITITWNGADAADIIANEAGTVTYGGDIRTPKKAQHIPGKRFIGWTFNEPTPEP